MPGDLNLALQQAQAICWDEGYGYRLDGEADSYADGVDCSGLVWKTLHDNGFSVGSSRFATGNMGPVLVSAGFTEIPYNSSYTPQHGDIVVSNHPGTDPVTDPPHGHTFYYAENVIGYTVAASWDQTPSTTGNCPKAKIEASGTRGHSGQGDHPNQYGAYTEVWVHNYNTFVSSEYLPGETKVYRLGGYIPPSPMDDAAAAVIALLFGKQGRHRPRR